MTFGAHPRQRQGMTTRRRAEPCCVPLICTASFDNCLPSEPAAPKPKTQPASETIKSLAEESPHISLDCAEYVRLNEQELHRAPSRKRSGVALRMTPEDWGEHGEQA